MFLEHVSEKHPTNDILVSAERCNKLRQPHIFNTSDKPVENTFDTEEPLQILHYNSGFELIWISTFPRVLVCSWKLQGADVHKMFFMCKAAENRRTITCIFVRLGSVEKEVETFSPFVAWFLLDVYFD